MLHQRRMQIHGNICSTLKNTAAPTKEIHSHKYALPGFGRDAGSAHSPCLDSPYGPSAIRPCNTRFPRYSSQFENLAAPARPGRDTASRCGGQARYRRSVEPTRLLQACRSLGRRSFRRRCCSSNRRLRPDSRPTVGRFQAIFAGRRGRRTRTRAG